MKRDFYTTPKSSAIMRFFWNAAGADRYILERGTYSDQIKYMCLGGIVVATGAMAGIAGGYAFYTIFEPRGSALESQFDIPTVILSTIFGTLWGLMIFNIDRFIVTSTGKGDGTEAITWDEFKGAIPRIVMGMIIAITISKPVEIRMFKSEIDVELHKAQMEKQREYLAEIDEIYQGRFDAENAKAKKWEDEIFLKQEDYRRLEERYLSEVEGKNSSLGRGDGPIAKSIKLQMDKAEQELELIKNKNFPLINESHNNRKKFEAEKQKDIETGQVVAAGLDGLLERIKLAHEIAGWGITIFITLLFMAIELTPIFFKLMLIKSPYDYIDENIKALIKAENGIYIEYNHFKDKQGIERDLVRNLNAEKQILQQKALIDSQKRLTEYAIAKYEEQMMEKIDSNPELYIQINNDEEKA
jgi:hypothetical protein